MCTYIWSSCLFNVHADSIRQDTGLDEAETGIKIVGRTINNLRYADNAAFMAKSKEELKRLLIKVKDKDNR